MFTCHFCGGDIGNPRDVYRNSTCPHCGKDLKICLNCKFFLKGAHWDCSETIEEPVADKDRANFCPYFAYGHSGGGSAKDGRTDTARKKLDQLFGND